MTSVRAYLCAAGAALALHPFPASAAGQAKDGAGKAVYDRECAQCHGATGKGDGEESAYVTPTPQDFTKGVLAKRSDDFLAAVILKGGEANGLSKSMPAFPKISRAEVDDVIAYLRQLGKGGSEKGK